MKDANPLSMNDATPLLVVETEGKTVPQKPWYQRTRPLATAAVALLVAAGAVAGTRSQGASSGSGLCLPVCTIVTS